MTRREAMMAACDWWLDALETIRMVLDKPEEGAEGDDAYKQKRWPQ